MRVRWKLTGLVVLALVAGSLLMACEGSQGDQGLRGEQGIQGDQGIPGEQGLLGIPGDQGIPGGQGIQGEQGLLGDQGLLGEQGSTGLSASELPPRTQLFSMAITDNAGVKKSGIALATLIFGEGTPDAATVVAQKGTPVVDGKDGDSAWGPASTISLRGYNGGGGPNEAIMQAAYDDQNVYLLVKWVDPTATKSVDKNMLTYNATSATWSKSGNEDRIFFIWNINATDFAPQGCSNYCHEDESAWEDAESKMGTNKPGEKVDVWHWKAARTNEQGHADDKYWVDIDHAEQLLYEGERVLRTRLADNGTSFAAGNVGDGQPKMMYRVGSIISPYLWDYEAVPFDPNAGWQDGDTIPGYVLSQLTGSNADVIAKSSYSNGTWVVEFKRALMTYNSNDVQFD